jgi:Transposase, Mutator family
MAAAHSVDPVQLLEQHLAAASPDLLAEMVASLANAMMSAQADQVCGAGYGQRSGERVNRRNGYRDREWDTRVGTVELAIPKLREGSYFCGLVADASSPRRTSPGHGGGHRVSAGSLHPAGGAPGRATRGQIVVALASQ